MPRSPWVGHARTTEANGAFATTYARDVAIRHSARRADAPRSMTNPWSLRLPAIASVPASLTIRVRRALRSNRPRSCCDSCPGGALRTRRARCLTDTEGSRRSRPARGALSRYAHRAAGGTCAPGRRCSARGTRSPAASAWSADSAPVAWARSGSACTTSCGCASPSRRCAPTCSRTPRSWRASRARRSCSGASRAITWRASSTSSPTRASGRCSSPSTSTGRRCRPCSRAATCVFVDLGVSRMVREEEERDDCLTEITRANRSVGTYEYMAPEQVLSCRDVAPSADLYAVGSILYRAVAGQHPFGELHGTELLKRKLSGAAPALVTGRSDRVALAFEALVARALATSPDERYESADEMLIELSHLRDSARRAARASHRPPTPSEPVP